MSGGAAAKACERELQQQLQEALQLYRQILRLHRIRLPRQTPQRRLANTFAAAEFRSHMAAAAEALSSSPPPRTLLPLSAVAPSSSSSSSAATAMPTAAAATALPLSAAAAAVPLYTAAAAVPLSAAAAVPLYPAAAAAVLSPSCGAASELLLHVKRSAAERGTAGDVGEQRTAAARALAAAAAPEEAAADRRAAAAPREAAPTAPSTDAAAAAAASGDAAAAAASGDAAAAAADGEAAAAGGGEAAAAGGEAAAAGGEAARGRMKERRAVTQISGERGRACASVASLDDEWRAAAGGAAAAGVAARGVGAAAAVQDSVEVGECVVAAEAAAAPSSSKAGRALPVRTEVRPAAEKVAYVEAFSAAAAAEALGTERSGEKERLCEISTAGKEQPTEDVVDAVRREEGGISSKETTADAFQERQGAAAVLCEQLRTFNAAWRRYLLLAETKELQQGRHLRPSERLLLSEEQQQQLQHFKRLAAARGSQHTPP